MPILLKVDCNIAGYQAFFLSPPQLQDGNAHYFHHYLYLPLIATEKDGYGCRSPGYDSATFSLLMWKRVGEKIDVVWTFLLRKKKDQLIKREKLTNKKQWKGYTHTCQNLTWTVVRRDFPSRRWGSRRRCRGNRWRGARICRRANPTGRNRIQRKTDFPPSLTCRCAACRRALGEKGGDVEGEDQMNGGERYCWTKTVYSICFLDASVTPECVFIVVTL